MPRGVHTTRRSEIRKRIGTDWALFSSCVLGPMWNYDASRWFFHQPYDLFSNSIVNLKGGSIKSGHWFKNIVFGNAAPMTSTGGALEPTPTKWEGMARARRNAAGKTREFHPHRNGTTQEFWNLAVFPHKRFISYIYILAKTPSNRKERFLLIFGGFSATYVFALSYVLVLSLSMCIM